MKQLAPVFTIVYSLMFALALNTQARAENLVVVELFTSQGCSSCPPADKFLAELTKRDDVLPLAFHVTYWDRLGWTDTFGDTSYTQRQYAYAKSFGKRSVWTPQFVVQGTDFSRNKFRDMVDDYIERHAKSDPQIAMTAAVDGDRVVVDLASPARLAENAIVQIIHFTPKTKVAVERGENANRTLSYHNVVTRFYGVADWAGRKPATFEADLLAERPFAVVVQTKGAGPILAAQVFR